MADVFLPNLASFPSGEPSRDYSRGAHSGSEPSTFLEAGKIELASFALFFLLLSFWHMAVHTILAGVSL